MKESIPFCYVFPCWNMCAIFTMTCFYIGFSGMEKILYIRRTSSSIIPSMHLEQSTDKKCLCLFLYFSKNGQTMLCKLEIWKARLSLCRISFYYFNTSQSANSGVFWLYRKHREWTIFAIHLPISGNVVNIMELQRIGLSLMRTDK